MPKQLVSDVARRRDELDPARLAPYRSIDLFRVPDGQVPVAFEATKIASLILRPERRFLDFTSFQRRIRPSLSFGNSSRISLRRQSFSFSRARLRPPGNIQRRSRLRRTKRTLPRLTATSFEDLAMMPLASVPIPCRLRASLGFGSAAADLRLTNETTIVHVKGPSPAWMDVDVLDDSVLDASIHHRKVSERGGAGTRYKDSPAP